MSIPVPLPLSNPSEPETYLVSGRAQDLVKITSKILEEGTQVHDSGKKKAEYGTKTSIMMDGVRLEC
jgi:hypothetical protein